MKIIPVSIDDKTSYNNFIRENYPPIGAFMQTWEWGEFQKILGRKVERYFFKEKNRIVVAFTLVHHTIPFGLSYGYIFRGPVFASTLSKNAQIIMFDRLQRWIREKFPKLIFVRLEPPIVSLPKEIEKNTAFTVPSYYIQPRFNTAVSLNASEEELLNSFHSSTRSNIHRATKRGVRVQISSCENLFGQFLEMEKDTIQRNDGVNAYPNTKYFQSLFKAVPEAKKEDDRSNLSIIAFGGHINDELGAIHYVLFFGNTATYLYGASYTKYLSSKVVTYLHWFAMLEAKKRGMQYYDIGGVDDIRWPSLTKFKQQFNGKEFRYVGNIDIPIRPMLYKWYNLVRRMKKS